MAKPNPLQEQLLKAGLVKKSKVAEVAREQVRARHGKGPVEPGEVAWRKATGPSAVGTTVVGNWASCGVNGITRSSVPSGIRCA